MEEQQQAEEQQQQHRGAGGSGGRGGAGAAAQGPHHGGCLTRNGAPPAGNPSRPRRGVAATASAVATPALFPRCSAQPRDPRRPGRVGGKGKRKGDCEGGLESCSSGHWGGARRGPARKEREGGRRTREQRRRFPQGCGEEEAEVPSVGAAGGLPSPGSGRRRRQRHGPAGAHPTISRSAPGSEWGGPQARAEPGAGPRGGGFLQTLQPGRLHKGETEAAGSV